MYPRNAASPERIAIGPVVQISDGAVQSSGVSVVVQPQGGSESAGSGTIAYSAASNSVLYTPTQAETNYTSVIITAYKTGCIPASATIVTTASATPGTVLLAPVTHTSAVVPTVSAVTGLTASNLDAAVSSRMATYTQPTGFLTATFPATVGSSTLTQTQVTGGAYALNSASFSFNSGLDLTTTQKASVTTAATAATPTAAAVTGAVGSVTGNVGGNVVGSVGSLVGHTAQTGDSFARIGATGSGLTSLASAANLATVAGYLDTEIADIKAKTDNLPAAPAAVGDIPSASAIADQVWDEILSGHVTGGSAGAALSAATAPTAAAVADAVWEEALGDHSATSGSVAEALAAAGGAGDPWITPLPGSYSSGQAGKIVGDYLNATVSSRATQTSVDDLPTNAELATALGTADDAVLAVLGTPAGASLAADVAAIKAQTAAIETDTAEIGAAGAGLTALASASNLAVVAGYLDTEIAAIKAKTDNLPSDPADASDIASSFSTVNSTLSTIAGYIDTEVAAIKAKTDNLPAAPAAVGDIPSAATVAAAVGAVVVEGSTTVVQSLRLSNAALGGKASGLDTTNPKYRDLADTKDRIDATVDVDGNRSAVTRDLT
jgi:hypothetical protein